MIWHVERLMRELAPKTRPKSEETAYQAARRRAIAWRAEQIRRAVEKMRSERETKEKR